jgi:histidine ammonia-lyase
VIELGNAALTLDSLVRLARAPVGTSGGQLRVAPEARERIARSHSVVERAVSEQRVIYGVTTGFGELKDRRIPQDQVRQLQVNLLRSHAAGVGAPAPRDVVRAMLVLRAASLAQGFSGCRPALVDALCELIESDVTPVVPLQGSVGASGDLAPLAHLALVLIGEGEAWLGEQRMPAGLALRGAGIQPLELEAKEGLALINGTQLSTALAALALADARRMWEAAVATAALSTEVLMGSFEPVREDVHALRPYRGAIEVARRLRTQSQGSALVESHRDCGRVQDAYSMRCIAPVLGASWDAFEHVERQLTIEFNAVNDNPLVFADSGDVVSAGLFHAQPVALVADYLKIAAAEVASISERRIDRLLDPRVSELPAVLAGDAGLESGYMLAQYTAAALVSENKVLCHPASVDSIPTGAGIEDHVSMAPIAGRHAAQVVENAARVIALEMLCAARALEFRRPLTAGEGSERWYAAIRRRVPAPEGDRPFGGDCDRLARAILAGEFDRATGETSTP